MNKKEMLETIEILENKLEHISILVNKQEKIIAALDKFIEVLKYPLLDAADGSTIKKVKHETVGYWHELNE